MDLRSLQARCQLLNPRRSWLSAVGPSQKATHQPLISIWPPLISIPVREVRRAGPKGACRPGGNRDQPIANHDQPIWNHDHPGGNRDQLLLSPRRSRLSAVGPLAESRNSAVDFDWASVDLDSRLGGTEGEAERRLPPGRGS